MSNTPNKDSVEERKIYLRVYDGKPVGYSDEKLRNEFLGTFAVEQVMFEDMYSEEFIGKRKEDGKHYIVTGIEVSGMRNPSIGGIRYEIKEIKLDNLLSQTRTEAIQEVYDAIQEWKSEGRDEHDPEYRRRFREYQGDGSGYGSGSG
jgi:hypothetical protein